RDWSSDVCSSDLSAYAGPSADRQLRWKRPGLRATPSPNGTPFWNRARGSSPEESMYRWHADPRLPGPPCQLRTTSPSIHYKCAALTLTDTTATLQMPMPG